MSENTILAAIDQICQEKRISKEQVLTAIEQSLAAAYRKDFGDKTQNIQVKFNPEDGQMEVFDIKTVVEDMPEEEVKENEITKEKTNQKQVPKDTDEEEKRRFNPRTEIQISEAKKIKKGVKVDDEIRQDLEVHSDFGRIAAQTAKQVIVQRLREAERATIYEKYKELEGEIINGTIQRQINRAFLVELGDASAIMPTIEQVPEENYQMGQKLKFLLVSVKETPKGPELILSRKRPEILIELFNSEVPEVANGSVEIKGIAREAGNRSKIAVWTKEKNLDPIGSCIGQRGVRIQTIISEIGGEKIDIIEWSEDPEQYIINALSPSKVTELSMNEKEKSAIAKVPKSQFSLAIGRAGQNVRLAAKLTGWRIDVQLLEDVKESEKEEPTENDEKPKDKTKKKDKKKKVKKSKSKKEKVDKKEDKEVKPKKKKKIAKKKTTKEEKKITKETEEQTNQKEE